MTRRRLVQRKGKKPQPRRLTGSRAAWLVKVLVHVCGGMAHNRFKEGISRRTRRYGVLYIKFCPSSMNLRLDTLKQTLLNVIQY